MTQGNEMLFYDAVAIICAVMTLANLARIQSRGLSAYFLGIAFLVLGGTVMLYGLRGPGPIVWAGGICVGLLLLADAVHRIWRQTRGPS